MASKKKLIVEDDIDSAAGHSLHAHNDNASHAGDPKSRFEHLASIIGAANAMRDEDLTKWWKQTIDMVGKEARQIPDGSQGRNSSSIDAKPSPQAPHSTASKYADSMPKLAEAMQQDLSKIFAEEKNLSDDSKQKMATLFESALFALVNLKEEEMMAQFQEDFDNEIIEAVADLAEATEAYLDKIADTWFEENEVAVESALRNELAEEFIMGLRQLFAEHFVDIPEEKVEIVDTLAAKIDELEAELAEAIDENAELRELVEQSLRDEVVAEACEGLTKLDAQRLIELSESINAEDEDDLRAKLKTLRESNFMKGKGRTPSMISEDMEHVEDDSSDDRKPVSPSMARYSAAISRTTRT